MSLCTESSSETVKEVNHTFKLLHEQDQCIRRGDHLGKYLRKPSQVEPSWVGDNDTDPICSSHPFDNPQTEYAARPPSLWDSHVGRVLAPSANCGMWFGQRNSVSALRFTTVRIKRCLPSNLARKQYIASASTCSILTL
jgi:hypothetical protein